MERLKQSRNITNSDKNYLERISDLKNLNFQVIITNDNHQEVFSSSGITNDKGLFETKYLIPDNSKRETLAITINPENENASSSKILQVFTLGNIPSDGGP